MNILCVTTLPPHPGGSAVSSALLTAGFAAAGHSVRVLAPTTADAQREGDPFAAGHPDINVTRFEVPYFEVAPNLAASADYRRTQHEQIGALLPGLIAEERPDILLMGRETFAWDVPDIANAHGVPCVLRLAGATTFGILNGTLPEPEARRLVDQYRKADWVISPARHLAERVQDLGLASIEVIWNAVDVRHFAPQPKDVALLRELRIADDDIVVAHVSNLKSMKRPLDLVDAAHEAQRQHLPLRYLVIGDGPCRQAMEAACRAPEIVDAFRFVGWIDQEHMPRYLNLADMVVLPSEAEAQARVYLETQACEGVIVASDIPAAREVVNDGQTGLLFRMGDPKDLADTIVRAARDPQGRAAIGRRARARVHAHALPTIAQAYLDLFAVVVDRHRATRGRHSATRGRYDGRGRSR